MKVLRLIEYFLIIIFFGTVVYFIFKSVLNPPSGYAMFADDMWRSYGFYRRFFVDSINRGIIPWWNPYLFSGMPLLANPSVSYFYPPTWIFFILPSNQAYSVIFAIQIFIALITMFWFTRRVLQLPIYAAIGPSLAYSMSGYFMARVWAGHAETLAASALIPWVFGSFIIAMRKLNYITITGAAFALAIQIYAGYQTVAMFTLEAVGITMLVMMILLRTFKPLIGVVLAVLLGLCLSAFQLLPSLEFFSHSIRTYTFPYSWVAYGSLITESLSQLFNPFALGDQYTFHGPPPNYPEQAMFVGISVLVFAIAAVIARLIRLPKLYSSDHQKYKTTLVIGLILIAILSLWISLGNNVKYDLHRILWEFLPMYKHIRFPPRHLILFIFAVCTLSGYGIKMLRFWWLQIGAAIIIFYELYPVATHFIELKPLAETQYSQEIISIIKNTSSLYRFLPNFGVWINQRNSFDADAAMVYGVYNATGYDPSILTNYYDFADAVNRNQGTSLLEHNVQIPYLDLFSPYIDFLNIKYVMVPSDFDPLSGQNTARYKLILNNPDRSYRVYENAYAMPRFFMVKSANILPTRKDVVLSIINQETDPKTTLLLSQKEIKDKNIFSANCKSDDIPIVRFSGYNPNEIILATESPCNSFLATSEIMYPGWEAYIDGIKTNILTNNLAYRALYIPGGRHVVVMRYVPIIFTIGGSISLVSFSLIMFAFVILRRRSFVN
jgi:hypothetical protein